MPHIFNINDLSKEQLRHILDKAQHYQSTEIPHHQKTHQHQGTIVANLFFENSTRTRNAFEIAEQQHGMMVLSPEIAQSALSKGETLVDMVLNLQAMGTRLFVVRHTSTDDVAAMAEALHPESALICAGSGCEHHPTQTLTDLYTIEQYKPDFQNISVTIIGDLIHSRVAHSLIGGLITMGVTDIRLTGPAAWMPPIEHPAVHKYDQLPAALKDTDVIYTLRVQKERIESSELLSLDAFHKTFGITAEHLTLANPDCIVMHPGPMNRGIEISSDVADGPQSVILEQVTNSIPTRMSAIDFALFNCMPIGTVL